MRVNNGVHVYLVGCSQTEAGPLAIFFSQGRVRLRSNAAYRCGAEFLSLGGSPYGEGVGSFGQSDWLSYSGASFWQRQHRLEDVQYGGTPNSTGSGPVGKSLSVG